MKRKIKPLSKLIKETDDLVSKYVRLRDKRCVTPTDKCTKVLQCSHLIKRGKMATRFDLKNCNCQCSYHNYLHNYSPEIYTAWFISRYGKEAYYDLVAKSRQIKKYTREEIATIQLALRVLIKQLGGN